jgi:multidrug efflux pump subunit AcrA (membrane-fusion protein)
MIGEAVFHLTAEKNKLVIPRKCIEGSLQQAHVFVVTNNKVVRRPVTAELLNDKLVSVISGLQPGEEVVTTGQINLTDGTSVRVLSNQ